MTPASPGVVSLDVARLAVEVQTIKGELALVTSTVGQSIQTLTTLVHEVQAEQLRAREDRLHQLGLLTGLTERSAGTVQASGRVHELELKVSRWIGVVVGFGAAVFMVFGLIVYTYQQDKQMQQRTIDANKADIRQLQDRARP